MNGTLGVPVDPGSTTQTLQGRQETAEPEICRPLAGLSDGWDVPEAGVGHWHPCSYNLERQMKTLRSPRRLSPWMLCSLVFFLIFGSLLFPSASPGQVVEAHILERETISFVLPKLKIRSKPLDDKVRIALYVPTHQDHSVYLVGFFALPIKDQYWIGGDRVKEVSVSHFDPNFGATFAKQYLIELSIPASERLSEIIPILFPRTTIYQEGSTPESEEIQLHSRVTSDFIKGDGTLPTGMRVHIVLTVTDAEGHQIAVVEGNSNNEPRRSIHLSIESGWSRIAARALNEAVEDLIRAIQANPSLKSRLNDLAKDRDFPAGIATNARFNDENALLPDGRLDAGDEGILLVQVSNQGPGPAYDVAVRVTSDQPQVLLSGNGTIGDLAPGESKEFALRVEGRLALPSSMAKLRIETSEKRGYGARPVLFELPTAQLVPPHLEIVDVALNDRPSSRVNGDGDGQPANGETLEAVVRVRNAGPGEAFGVAVLMASPKTAAEILVGKTVLPRIAADRVEEARLLFRLPLTLQASQLPLSFQAVEARTKHAVVEKEQTWKIRSKRPAVELAYRLYDGSSSGSTGNRDSLVSNGERIEVVVTPANRGDLPARSVRIAIESADPSLIPRPATLEVGDLPPLTEGAAQRFSFDVPRGYGSNRPVGDLRFTLNVSQKDFPSTREPVILSFRPLRPTLSLEIATPLAIARGGNGELLLQARNTGTLRAEDVVLDVTSEAPGVDLLNERGVPVSSRRITLGALDQQGNAPEQQMRVNIRRNAAIGAAPLRVTISQKDFPSVVQSATLAVTDEPEDVITAVPPEGGEQERASIPAFGAPPTISFLRNTEGEHLITEAIVLRFEVQSAADLAEVRLTQNERLLPLEAARRTASSAGGMQVTQYEIPVQLEEGENRFKVFAINRQGLKNERPLKLFRDHEFGRIWVVAIGVSKYQDPAIPSLRYADADARAVFDYFRDTFGLPENQIFLRINEQATLREVKSVLGTQLVARANDPRDTVILYLAGHGMRDRVTGSLDADGLSKYFLPYDASRTDLYSTALDMDEVTNILRRLTPERVVVLLDSCFSGAAGGRSPFDPAAEGERAPITGEFLDRMAHIGKGRVVLTASGPEESAQESADFAHGVFTYYLLEGLRGEADLSGDGEIDVHEIYRYVSERVSRETKGRQNPKLKEPDLVGRILLGRGAVRGRR